MFLVSENLVKFIFAFQIETSILIL